MRRFLAIVLGGTVTLAAAEASTIVPAGGVSGTWTPAGSPYLVMGNINVASGATLTVEPGVEIAFQGYYSLTIYGYLQAAGTEADSISFTAIDDWNGLTFQDAPDSSHVEYCSLTARSTSVALISCLHSNPVIAHSTIRGNSSFVFTGGLWLNGSGPRISCCTIRDNNGYAGGGILCDNGSFPIISSCTIMGNSATYAGGGIAVRGNADPIISGCTLIGNHAANGGGVAFLDGGGGTISNCTLADNSAPNMGGGIYVTSPGATCSLTNSTLTGNDSNYSGGGIHVQSAAGVSIDRSIIEGNACAAERGGAIYAVACGDLAIDHCDILNNTAFGWTDGIFVNGPTNLAVSNCIFRSQQGFHIAFTSYLSAAVTYSDFYDSGPWAPFGGGPGALGEIVGVNANGDPCDVFYNIFLDPLLVDFPGGDYHLTENSPCIDAGDPACAPDMDGSITDMGVYWYDQRRPVIALSTDLLDFGVVPVGTQADLPLAVYNLGDTTLVISAVECDLDCFSTDFDPADSLIAAGDSLVLMVSFIPPDSLEYAGTLSIVNNDAPAAVVLLGEGDTGPAATEEAPAAFALQTHWSNPAGSRAVFQVQLPVAARLRLGIYDLSGRRVSELLKGWWPAGVHELVLDVSSLPAGLYLYRCQAGNQTVSGKVVIVE